MALKADRYATTASMNLPHPTLLMANGYTFNDADIGKVVKVDGAGKHGTPLTTTIIGVRTGKAVLADPCQAPVTTARCIFGTDNTAAITELLTQVFTGSEVENDRRTTDGR